MSLIIKQDALRKREPELEEEWIEYQDGVKFLIRGIASKVVQVGLAAKHDQQARVYSTYNTSGNLSALKMGKTSGEIGDEMVAELVVADWEGLELESGERLPYSADTAAAILTNPEYKDLAIWVLAESTGISEDAKKRVEKRLGKS